LAFISVDNLGSLSFPYRVVGSVINWRLGHLHATDFEHSTPPVTNTTYDTYMLSVAQIGGSVAYPYPEGEPIFLTPPVICIQLLMCCCQ
jgi:hypothetical protein